MATQRENRRKYHQAIEEQAKSTEDHLKAAMFFDRISLALSIMAIVLSLVSMFK